MAVKLAPPVPLGELLDCTSEPLRHTVEMYPYDARTFTPLLTSKLFGFNFVIHFTPRMHYSFIRPNLLTVIRLDRTQNLENLFSNTHSCDEQLYTVFQKKHPLI